ncbi:hypothetical protein BaRGS_00019054 [Batillaria attramentaria]|uniref:Cytochrome P450 n=1 Tax=Batillaria attramentaria TaxID=370345 RepID=A0ABD0KR47_9CAEN|nr:hypothetical protein BaRGS_027839 [Batillaria attramentaria]
MVAVTVYLALAATALVFAYFRFVFRFRRENEAPYVPGHFLWGNGAEFAQNAVRFLHKSQKALGDIFTIRLLNQYLTIVMDPHCYEKFSKERRFDFDPIQKQVNNNVFGFELKSARKMIYEAGKKVNGRYLGTGMEAFAANLQEVFRNIQQQNANPKPEGAGDDAQWQSEGLRMLTSRTLFSAVFYTIFGKSASVQDIPDFNPQTFHDKFDTFHKFFNYLWLGMPVKLFPKACDAVKVLFQQPLSQDMLTRDGLSDYIRFSTEYMLQHGQSEQDIMGHNLVFLHVNYNTFRVAYWCVYQMLEHPEFCQDLAHELKEAIEARRVEGDDAVGFTLEDIDHLPLLDSFLKETLRLASGVFMVRYVTEDTDFDMPNGETYTVRKGDRVAMYPPTIHMDPEIFENPETFKHDRFVNAKFYKYGKELKNPVLTFGSLCPGKRFSMLQIKWFLMNLINSFDLHLPEGERTQPNTEYYGHEILPPTHDVKVQFRPIPDAPALFFVPRRSPRS